MSLFDREHEIEVDAVSIYPSSFQADSVTIIKPEYDFYPLTLIFRVDKDVQIWTEYVPDNDPSAWLAIRHETDAEVIKRLIADYANRYVISDAHGILNYCGGNIIIGTGEA